MSTCGFPEPPTRSTLEDARRELGKQRSAVEQISTQIQAAEDDLDRIVMARKVAIQEMHKERAVLEDQMSHTLAYLAHIRRLPHELLRHIFTFIFEDYPCCAWVLAAVCSLWRRQVLSMPRLWSKIRLVTTQNSSPDTVRLWLERSGTKAPLDIEIFLHTPRESSSHHHHHHRRSSTSTLSTVSAWDAPWWENDLPGATPAPETPTHGTGPGYLHIPPNGPPHFVPATAVPPSPPLHHHVHGGATPIYHEVLHVPSWRRVSQASGSSSGMHWGYIAFYYLMQQMHRWERFVFRFDRQFTSINALKTMIGDAPLLREFEVSGAEPALFNDWSWIPSARPGVTTNLPVLTSLTLQYVPFRWSSPIFRNLRSLCLRTLPGQSLAVDRLLYILSSNPNLETLSLHVSTANPAVLPTSQTALENMKTCSVGGHYLLAALVDCLTLPVLESLTMDIDARDPIEDTLTQLLVRSNHPPVTYLSISYGLSTSGAGMYYHGGSAVTSWNFLGELDGLRTLQVGSAPFEPLVAILGTPEDDGQDQWYCPALQSLLMKACRPSHADGVAKLVQMVEARNPDPASGAVPVTAGGVAPVKLRHLELHDCAALGLDVMKWLKNRVPEVRCTDPPYDPTGLRSPSFQYL
ncbi:F-box protein [Phanerochaete sordida]|uniref:F-box protein n=1 Tax=Phanerochaete sordida TaxID=48140 RepID=A0A9P3L905_9APHY|nr:F-box protein [Phanerochaete sordida]